MTEAKSHQGFRDAASIIGVLASALLLAAVLITFVFQSYQVSGVSMQPSLQNNDHMIIWKVPKTLAKITGHHYIPNRGDVVVIHEDSVQTGDEQIIKRVIGLPGERVVVRDDKVTVYNMQFPNGFMPDKSLPYGSVISSTPGDLDVTVGDDEVYVLGDNRLNSTDSRILGPIESDQIIGKLVARILPLNSFTIF